MVRSMLRVAIASAALFLSAGLVAAQQIEGLHGKAASAIEADIRELGFMSPVQAYVFYGDLSGRGTNDAVALLYHPTGGNSDEITQWLFRDTGSGYRRSTARRLGEVFGIDPRNVKLSPGRIEITMTVMNPGDPRCCPTGEKTYIVALDERGEATQQQSTPRSSTGPWTAIRTDSPVGVRTEATSRDGRVRMIGACAVAVLDPGFWWTFAHDSDAPERTDQKAELLQIEITSRSGVRYFTVSTIYEGADNSWVADRPLSKEFLDAFAGGNEMTISLGAEGNRIASFGMRGTAKSVAMMREICGPAVMAATPPVALPFTDGRYLSDASLCGLDDEQIVDRIGDEIHYVLYVIKHGQIGSAESLCDVLEVDRQGDLVRMNAECAVEGMVNAAALEMTYLSEQAFRVGERVFERCE